MFTNQFMLFMQCLNWQDNKILIIIGILVLLDIIIVAISAYKHKNGESLFQEESGEEITRELGYEYDSKENVFYSTKDPWQKKYGYCKLYDDLAPISGMVIDCEPIYFNYNGEEWLIELWKGQYGMTLGCEVGVYKSNGKRIKFHNLINQNIYYGVDEEEFLEIECTLLQKGNIIFSRKERHWWVTGFKLGEFSMPDKLFLIAEIRFNDIDMLEAFVQAAKALGYVDNQLFVKDDIVTMLFKDPYSKQPSTRNKVMDKITQKKNELMCKSYKLAIKDTEDFEEKLLSLKIESPSAYKKLINLARGKIRLLAYRIIERYIV